MEITSTSNSGPVQPRRQSPDERVDITRLNRDGIQAATVDISEIRAPQEPFALRLPRQSDDAQDRSAGGDRIELSGAARRLLARDAGETKQSDDSRQERIADLQRAYRDRTLNTRERVERAAEGMLSES